MRHWHEEAAPATDRFIREAPFTPTEKGLQAVIEVIAYPEGKVQVAVSRISGPRGSRKIGQANLMFNDMGEAKGAVDAVVDRLADEAAR